MNHFLSNLGLGALLLYAALPLLYWTARRPRDAEPSSRQRLLVALLGLDVLLLAVPFVRDALNLTGPAHLTLPAVSVPLLPAFAPVTAAPADMAPILASLSRALLTPLSALGAAWLALAAGAALRIALQRARLRRRVRRAGTLPGPTLALVGAVARSLDVRPPNARLSGEVSLPFVTGLVRPTLVLPARLITSLDATAVELVIRHEVIHLARADNWWSAGVSLLRSMLPFHPIARRIQAEYALAREEAVDALVAPTAPRAYAHLLLDAAAFRDDLEPMVAMSGTQLAHRIGRLTNGSPLRKAGMASSALAFLAMGTLLIAIPRCTGQPDRSASAWVADGSESVIHLDQGTIKVATIPGIARLAVDDTEIAEVKSLGNTQVAITGVGPGKTTLRVWKSSGERVLYSLNVRGSPGAKEEEKTIELAIGAEAAFTFPGLARIAVGNPEIVDVTARGDEVRIRGVAEGRTLLLLWTADERRKTRLVSVAGPARDSTLSTVETVLQHKHEILECVRQQKAQRPDLNGTLVMSWTIEPSGRTSGVGTKTDEFRDTPLVSCLTALLQKVSFPPQATAEATDFPFKF